MVSTSSDAEYLPALEVALRKLKAGKIQCQEKVGAPLGLKHRVRLQDQGKDKTCFHERQAHDI